MTDPLVIVFIAGFVCYLAGVIHFSLVCRKFSPADLRKYKLIGAGLHRRARGDPFGVFFLLIVILILISTKIRIILYFVPVFVFLFWAVYWVRYTARLRTAAAETELPESMLKAMHVFQGLFLLGFSIALSAPAVLVALRGK